MLTKFQESFKEMVGFALPMKLVMGALIGIIIGPGFLGFLSELATYYFAINQGVRPPLEGIPYLRAAVTFGSVFLTFAAAIVFFITFRLAASLAAQIGSIYGRVMQIQDLVLNKEKRVLKSKSAFDIVRQFSLRKVILVSLSAAFLLSTSTYFILSYLQKPAPLKTALCLAAYFILTIFILWKRQIIWWVASLVTFTSYLAVIVVMFNVVYYGKFLRFVGYGGGLPITIELSNSVTSNQRNYEAYLVLRTTSAIIVYDSSENEIREFQLPKVRSLKYQTQPLSSSEYVLPRVF